jgi:hypothetical protein
MRILTLEIDQKTIDSWPAPNTMFDKAGSLLIELICDPVECPDNIAELKLYGITVKED